MNKQEESLIRVSVVTNHFFSDEVKKEISKNIAFGVVNSFDVSRCVVGFEESIFFNKKDLVSKEQFPASTDSEMILFLHIPSIKPNAQKNYFLDSKIPNIKEYFQESSLLRECEIYVDW